MECLSACGALTGRFHFFFSQLIFPEVLSVEYSSRKEKDSEKKIWSVHCGLEELKHCRKVKQPLQAPEDPVSESSFASNSPSVSN